VAHDARESGEQWLEWTVRERASGRVIGRVETTVYDGGRARIAYVFTKDVHGRGFAVEACTTMITAIRAAGASRIEATIDARNAPSLALACTLGMHRAERLPAANIHANGKSDEEVWALDDPNRDLAKGV
jgi:RimJ/RimL family protein N-acetyltransferase